MDRIIKILLFSVIGLAVIGIVGTMWIARTGLPPLPTTTSQINAKPAPDFKLELFSGKKIRLSDFKGRKPVVLNLWASWCPPCRAEAPMLSKVSKDYSDRVKFIGVAINDNPQNAKLFLKEFDITYDNGMDPGNIGNDYRITGIPETFWIDTKGRIIDHWIGAVDESELVARTERLISQSGK